MRNQQRPKGAGESIGLAHNARPVRVSQEHPPTPCEPSLLTCARELLGFLGELSAVQDETRRGLLSPEPAELLGSGSDEPDDSLEATLRRSCRMAAFLVGEAHTMNAKLLG